MTEFASSFLALLAAIAHVGLVGLLAVGLASLVSSKSRHVLDVARDSISGLELPLAWVVALVATSGSLYFSEVAGFLPCHLCWYQRYAMYPLVLVLGLTALSRYRRFAPLLLPIPLVGLGISAYHHYIERYPEAESASCKRGVPCSVRWIWELGYVSIPVLAGTAFALITVLLVASWRRPAPVSHS